MCQSGSVFESGNGFQRGRRGGLDMGHANAESLVLVAGFKGGNEFPQFLDRLPRPFLAAKRDDAQLRDAGMNTPQHVGGHFVAGAFEKNVVETGFGRDKGLRRGL